MTRELIVETTPMPLGDVNVQSVTFVWGFDLAMGFLTPATTTEGDSSYNKIVWQNLDGGSVNNPDNWGEIEFSATSAAVNRRARIGGP